VLAISEEEGVTCVEIGIPYSDPLADGPVIQHASRIALQHGAGPMHVLSIVREIRKSSEIPVLLMGYVNPFLHIGVDVFLNAAEDAGVDGFIIPDLPPEESSSIHRAAVDRELLTVWDEWDIDGDGRYDTHTINTKSTPDEEPLVAKVGEKVRLVMANVGAEVHAPHMHGVKWTVIDPSALTPLSKNYNGVLSLAPAQIKVVEFIPPNLGIWLFHCHVLPHVADDGLYHRGMLTRLNVLKGPS